MCWSRILHWKWTLKHLRSFEIPDPLQIPVLCADPSPPGHPALFTGSYKELVTMATPYAHWKAAVLCEMWSLVYEVGEITGEIPASTWHLEFSNLCFLPMSYPFTQTVFAQRQPQPALDEYHGHESVKGEGGSGTGEGRRPVRNVKQPG